MSDRNAGPPPPPSRLLFSAAGQAALALAASASLVWHVALALGREPLAPAALALLALLLIPLTLAVRVALRRLVAPALAGELGQALAWLLACLTTGALFVVCYPVTATVPPRWPLFTGALAGVDLVTVTLATLILTSWLRLRPSADFTPAPRRRRLPRALVFALPCLAVWTAMLLIYWPGMMSPDSIEQWRQSHIGSYSNAHPAIHTMLIWAVTRLWDSPAAVALLQVLAMSAVVGLGFAELERRGASTKVIWASVILTALSVTNSLFVVTLWKDIAYTALLVGLTVMVMRIVLGGGTFGLPRWNLALLVLVAAGTALIRHNGVAPAFVTLLALALWCKPLRLRLLAVLGAAVVTFLVVQGPLYRAAQVIPMTAPMRHVLPVYYLSSHVARGSDFTEQEGHLLGKIRSNWFYDFNGAHSVVKGTSFDFIEANKGAFYSTFFRISLRNPINTLAHIFNSTNFVWMVTLPSGGYTFTSCEFREGSSDRMKWVSANRLLLLPDSRFPAAERWYTTTLALPTCPHNTAGFILSWRSAQYLYLFLLALVFLALARRQAKVLLIAVPIVAHTAFLMLISVSPDFRYQYPAYLLGWSFGLPLLSMLGGLGSPSPAPLRADPGPQRSAVHSSSSGDPSG